MKCSFSKASSDKDGKRKLHPVTCKLCDARGRDLSLSGLECSTTVNGDIVNPFTGKGFRTDE